MQQNLRMTQRNVGDVPMFAQTGPALLLKQAGA
jgi:hypothetical protein